MPERPNRSEFYNYITALGGGHGLFLATGGIDIPKVANSPLAMRLGIEDDEARAERFVELIRDIINTLSEEEAQQRQRRALEVALNFPSASVPGKTLTARFKALSELSDKSKSSSERTLQENWYDGADWLARQLAEEINKRQRSSQQTPETAAVDSTAQTRIQHDDPVPTARLPEEQEAASDVRAELRKLPQENQFDANSIESPPQDHGVLSPPKPPANLAPDTAIPSPHPRRLTTRRAVVYISAIIAVVAGVIVFIIARQGEDDNSGRLKNGWLAATCTDIGNNQPGNPDPLWRNLFRDAYQRAGGEAELGCPRTDDPSGYVHPWGNCISQDLQGGKGKARIMALRDSRRVFIVAGSYYEDYTNPYGDNAAQTMGCPISDPIACGPTYKVVLLDGAERTRLFEREQTPSVMVTNPRTGRLIWVPREIWERYVTLGGPLGRLGGPTSNLEQTAGGAIQYFENGYIKIVNDAPKTDLEDQGRQEPPPAPNLVSCLPI